MRTVTELLAFDPRLPLVQTVVQQLVSGTVTDPSTVHVEKASLLEQLLDQGPLPTPTLGNNVDVMV